MAQWEGHALWGDTRSDSAATNLTVSPTALVSGLLFMCDLKQRQLLLATETQLAAEKWGQE